LVETSGCLSDFWMRHWAVCVILHLNRHQFHCVLIRVPCNSGTGTSFSHVPTSPRHRHMFLLKVTRENNTEQKKDHDHEKKATIDDVKKWASVQRGEYSRFMKGLKSKITSGQLAKLNGIAFEWIPPKRKHILKAHDEEDDNLMSMSPGITKEKVKINSWEFMFEQYKQYNSNTAEKQQKQSNRENEALKLEAKNEARKEARK